MVKKEINIKESKEQLTKRLDLYAHAMSVNDFDATYSLESEETRKKLSFEEYLRIKHSSNAEQEVYKVSRIQYDKKRDEYYVKMKVTLVNLPKVTRLSLADTRGEWWKFENGDWYRRGAHRKKAYQPKKKEPSEEKIESETEEAEQKTAVKPGKRE